MADSSQNTFMYMYTCTDIKPPWKQQSLLFLECELHTAFNHVFHSSSFSYVNVYTTFM